MSTRSSVKYRIKQAIYKHLIDTKSKRVPFQRRKTSYLYLTVLSVMTLIIVLVIVMNLWQHSYASVNIDFFRVDDTHHNISSDAFSFWECFTNGINNQLFDSEYKCILHQTAITLNHELARGGQGTVYLITINKTTYALKHSYAKDACYHLQREWRILNIIGSNPHALSLHHKLDKLYKGSLETHCFIILQFINNSITIYDLLEYHSYRMDQIVSKTTLDKIQHDEYVALDRIQWMKDADQLLTFVLRCYESIKSILYTLSDEFIYYADELIHNVMLRLDDNECILIDYGLVIQMKDFADIMAADTHLDHKLRYSPYSAYFLKNFESRKHLMNRYIFKGNAIKLFRKIAHWNTMHKLAAFAFRVFLSVYVKIMKESQYMESLNNLQFSQLEALKDTLYDWKRVKNIEAHRFWRKRSLAIQWSRMQITALNEKYHLFEDNRTQQWLEILNDIHTEESMYHSHVELMAFLH